MYPTKLKSSCFAFLDMICYLHTLFISFNVLNVVENTGYDNVEIYVKFIFGLFHNIIIAPECVVLEGTEYVNLSIRVFFLRNIFFKFQQTRYIAKTKGKFK